MTDIQTVPLLLRPLRCLPARLPGKRRLANALVNALMVDGLTDIEAQGITFRVPSIREPVAMGLIADGCYESELCLALKQSLRPDSVFFDVGANIGVFSLFAARSWCPQGRVIGFEASPQIHSLLEHNRARHALPALTVLHRAVTERSGDHLAFYDAPSAKFGMGSLANRFQSEGQMVPTISLDDAATELGLPRVDAIKVDVEGFELGVFRGAQRILAQNPAPVIFFEFNDWAEERGESHAGDAQGYLQSLGYVTVPLEAWLKGDRQPRPPITSGGADIVAFKPSAASAD